MMSDASFMLVCVPVKALSLTAAIYAFTKNEWVVMFIMLFLFFIFDFGMHITMHGLKADGQNS